MTLHLTGAAAPRCQWSGIWPVLVSSSAMSLSLRLVSEDVRASTPNAWSAVSLPKAVILGH